LTVWSFTTQRFSTNEKDEKEKKKEKEKRKKRKQEITAKKRTDPLRRIWKINHQLSRRKYFRSGVFFATFRKPWPNGNPVVIGRGGTRWADFIC